MDLGHARVDPEVADLVRKGAEALAKGEGFELVDVKPAWGPVGPTLIRDFWAAHMTRCGAVAAVGEPDGSRAGGMHQGRAAVTMAQYQDMRIRKMAYIADIHMFFEDWDFLITPTVSVAAFPAERLIPEHWPQHPWDWIQWAEFSYPFNMSWNPAATVPCGFTKEGLPVGMQIVGRRFDDLGVMQASRAFERIMPWADKRPKMDW